MFYDDDDYFFREIEKEMRKMMKIVERMMHDLENSPPGKPVIHGIRIKIGPDGVPRVEEFGNVRMEGEKPRVVDYREPLVDVIKRERDVIVTAELPGVEKKDVQVKVRGNKLYLDAKGMFRYRKVVKLPAAVDARAARATFKNGILEVTLPIKEGASDEVNIRVD